MIEDIRHASKPSSSARRRSARSAATGTWCSSARSWGPPAAAVYAFKRPPVYTATARLSAVSVNASNAASLAGSLEAAQELAEHVRPRRPEHAGRQRGGDALHTTPAWVVAHVSGTPVPTSPFVTISANASTAGVAKTAANAALTALDGMRASSSARRPARRRCWPRSATYSIPLSRAADPGGASQGPGAERRQQV